MVDKTKLGYVSMGESKRDKMEGSYNFLCGNSISTIGQKNLSYGILP